MLKDFDFSLPKELIADYPLERGQAKLLYYDGERIQEGLFTSLIDFLTAGDLLVFNNSKVIPAFLISHEGIKINLIKKINENIWSILGKPRKKILLGSFLTFSERLQGKITNKGDLDLIEFNLSGEDFYQELEKSGFMPLPPYIKRKPDESDKKNYQTVFAEVPGSVAAPTAGLHFSREFLASLLEKGIERTSVTLEVGGGTFLPVKVDKLDDHKMHYENYYLSSDAANRINHAKKEGRRVIAVGTTSARTLEAAKLFCEGDLYPHTRETNLFIRPGFDFKIVDGLITNFHLPKSTLFVLIASYLGSLNEAKKLYNYAIEQKYRFFSYGDSSFLTKKI
jgi:S-adenosylmethionine:tRNA ribosyltransferase-isomerase